MRGLYTSEEPEEVYGTPKKKEGLKDLYGELYAQNSDNNTYNPYSASDDTGGDDEIFDMYL
jgi:hypothetical protein